MKIGIVVDLSNYRDYFERFNKLTGKTPCIEIHLLDADIVSPEIFFSKIEKAMGFFREANVRILGIHFLDKVINNIINFEMFNFEHEYSLLCPTIDMASEVEKLDTLLAGAAHASRCLGHKVKVVIHEGIFFKTDLLEKFNPVQLKELRAIFLKRIGRIHAKYFSISEKEIDICLENSPPFSGSGFSTQHFIDQVIPDITGRLKPSEKLVFDISHWFMCCEYLRKDGRGVWGLDILKDVERDNILPLNGYDILEKISSNVGWIHLNDCSGIDSEHEGLSLFQDNSLVNWERLLGILKLFNAPMLLEISGSEKDFSLIEKSFFNLNELWCKNN